MNPVVRPSYIFTRAYPESFSFRGEGTNLALLWLLKNPGYGDNLVKIFNGEPISKEATKDPLTEDSFSIREDQRNLAYASQHSDGHLPWEPFEGDPEG